MAATPSEETVRKAFNIAESATLLGYVVFLPEENEYLAFVKKDADGNPERGYGASPHNAQVFPSYAMAQKASSLLTRKSEVGFLFDQEDQLAVYAPSRLH